MRRTNLNEIVGSPSDVAVHPFKFSGFPKTVYTPSFYGIERFFVDISLRSYHTIRRTMLTRPSDMSRFEEKAGQEDFVFEIR